MVKERLTYEVLDVFTDHAYAGNPLAVVHGAEDLSAEQMHAIAMEFNLSETTFPMAPTEEQVALGADYFVRNFTPAGEIPFAGHPTLGTAWALRQRGIIRAGDRVQSCGAGMIGVRLGQDRAEPVELSADPRDLAHELSAQEAAELCSLVGLTAEDIAGPAYLAGCGLTWSYLQVRADSVSRARPTGRRITETTIDLSGLLDPTDGVDVYAVMDVTEADGLAGEGLRINARAFVPGFGIPEDPATGSAAVGLGMVLVANGLGLQNGITSYRIDQGVDMGRPSVLHGRVEAVNGSAVRCHVAGQVAPVAGGVIVVPGISARA